MLLKSFDVCCLMVSKSVFRIEYRNVQIIVRNDRMAQHFTQKMKMPNKGINRRFLTYSARGSSNLELLKKFYFKVISSLLFVSIKTRIFDQVFIIFIVFFLMINISLRQHSILNNPFEEVNLLVDLFSSQLEAICSAICLKL